MSQWEITGKLPPSGGDEITMKTKRSRSRKIKKIRWNPIQKDHNPPFVYAHRIQTSVYVPNQSRNRPRAARNRIYTTKHPPSILFISRPSSSPRSPSFLQNSAIYPMTMMNGPQQNIPAYVTRTHPPYPPRLISCLISTASGHGTSNLPNVSFVCTRHAHTPNTRRIFPSTISSATLGFS